MNNSPNEIEVLLFKYVAMIDRYPKNFYENVLSIHFAEADTEEDVELLILHPNTSTKLSKSDVLKKLKKANLTGQGFKKGVSYQTVKSDGSSTYFKASIAIFA